MPHPCSFIGTFLCLAAAILLLFAHLGQISNSQKVPRSLRMTTLDTTGFGNAVSSTGASAASLYGSGARNGPNSGIRQYYSWGLWEYCESSGLDNTADYCSGNSFGSRFEPASTLFSDVPTGIGAQVGQLIPDSTFVASGYTGTFTLIAFWLLFVGAILAGVATVLSVCANRFSYVLAAIVAFLGFACVAAAATIWTVIIAKIRNAINGATTANGTSLGLNLSYGNSLWICWGAAAALLFAVVPLFIACCTGRNKRDHDDDYYDSGASAYGGTSRYAGSTRSGSQRRSKYDSQSIRY